MLETEKFTVENFDDVVVIQTKYATATTENAAAFKELVLSKIDQGQTKIIVDLTQLKYMDSSFLGSLVLSLKKSVAKGGMLKIVLSNNINPVWTMFDNTQMFKVFQTHNDVDSALKSFD